MGLAQRIRYLRLLHGLTQQQLARQLNICRATLSHYENGLREPDLQMALAIADFFGVSLDFLCGRTSLNCYWLESLNLIENYECLVVPVRLLRVDRSLPKKIKTMA